MLTPTAAVLPLWAELPGSSHQQGHLTVVLVSHAKSPHSSSQVSTASRQGGEQKPLLQENLLLIAAVHRHSK